MPNENDNKLVTLADLAEAYNALYNRDVVTTATQSANGLMSSTDKTKLDGIAAGAQVNSVTSVNNQTGAVSITPASIGAVSKAGGDIINGGLLLKHADSTIRYELTAWPNNDFVISGVGSIYSEGWARLVYIQSDGTITLIAPLPVISGGTGATTPDGACASIGAVKKSGDTMTGPLITNSAIIQNSGYIFGADENGATYHALKLGHTFDNVMQFYEYGAQFDFIKSTSESNTTLFQIKDGVSAYPLPVNNGGTGMTDAETFTQYTTNLGSDASGRIRISRWGKMYIAHIAGFANIPITAEVTPMLSLTDSNYAPNSEVWATFTTLSNEPFRVHINSSGNLYSYKNFEQDTWIYGEIMWFAGK